jgi:hypothetical protein
MDELRERTFLSLADALRGPLTVERMTDWAHADEALRTTLLDGRIFGTIRWKQSVGRSLGATLASGFRIDHAYHELNWVVGADGQPHDVSRWKQGSEAGIWDRADDEGYFEVGFACWGVKPWENRVEVRISDTQPWDTRLQLEVRNSYRVVVPAVQVVVLAGKSFAVLEPATVEAIPIRRFG